MVALVYPRGRAFDCTNYKPDSKSRSTNIIRDPHPARRVSTLLMIRRPEFREIKGAVKEHSVPKKKSKYTHRTFYTRTQFREVCVMHRRTSGLYASSLWFPSTLFPCEIEICRTEPFFRAGSAFVGSIVLPCGTLAKRHRILFPIHEAVRWLYKQSQRWREPRASERCSRARLCK